MKRRTQSHSSISPDPHPRLTARERECLTWCALGRTSEDIGEILGITEGVVRIHVQNAQRKLDCLNRTHAVAKALACNLIAFPAMSLPPYAPAGGDWGRAMASAARAC